MGIEHFAFDDFFEKKLPGPITKVSMYKLRTAKGFSPRFSSSS